MSLSSVPEEPVLELGEIQGNVLPGFNKDHLSVLFLRSTEAGATRAWLQALAPFVSTAEELLQERRLRRALRVRTGLEPTGIVGTWVNVGITAAAIARLNPVAEFADEAFGVGLAGRAGLLGDAPDGSGEPGDPQRWLVGGPRNPADIVLLVASDAPSALRRRAADLLRGAEAAGLSLVFRQDCSTLPGALRGHEHFGFRDGISTPGVRGRVSDGASDFLTARLLDSASPEAALFARPGQVMIWPGQFVFGYPRQDPQDPLLPVPEPDDAPDWARNGSFLVIRRLRQDVRAFRRGVQDVARQLATTHLPLGVPEVAARLVGRWPSGAPVMRSQEADLAALGAEALANNDFGYQSAPPVWRLANGRILPPFPAAIADPDAIRCPRGAHIRKMNPRDQATDIGPAAVTLARSFLRRGLPFGKPYDLSLRSGRDTQRGDRGLMFISCQTSIVDQFEFLLSDWANHADKPNSSPDGHDPIVGRPAGGGPAVFDLTDGRTPVRCLLDPRWVVPTGGGYFFAPSISALQAGLR